MPSRHATSPIVDLGAPPREISIWPPRGPAEIVWVGERGRVLLGLGVVAALLALGLGGVAAGLAATHGRLMLGAAVVGLLVGVPVLTVPGVMRLHRDRLMVAAGELLWTLDFGVATHRRLVLPIARIHGVRVGAVRSGARPFLIIAADDGEHALAARETTTLHWLAEWLNARLAPEHPPGEANADEQALGQ